MRKLLLPGGRNLGMGVVTSDNDVLLQKALLRVIMRALSGVAIRNDATDGNVSGWRIAARTT
jgi:hypothetical protein